jgi:hypothetical protein
MEKISRAEARRQANPRHEGCEFGTQEIRKRERMGELKEKALTAAYERQKAIPLMYRGRPIGEHRLDLFVGGRVVVESPIGFWLSLIS